MNYKESSKILDEIKKVDKILLNCHRSPDPDSVGSAISLYLALIQMGKKVTIICPSEIPQEVKFLPLSEKIETEDFAKFDFSEYDLFICLDSASLGMVTGRKDIKKPNIPVVVIDHHKTNEHYGSINLVDGNVSSTAELLYLIFEDWEIQVDKDIAQALLAGILSDTGVFAYSGVTAKTIGIAQKLMETGADKDEIILEVFHSHPFNKIKFWGEIIRKMELDKAGKFVWSAIPHEDYLKFDEPLSAKESAASLIFQSIADTDFGMVMVEEQKGAVSISLRARTDFDVSKIAVKLGGGGHKAAAGAKVYGANFEDAVKEVLSSVKAVINENKT